MTFLIAAILTLQDADTIWRDLGIPDAGLAYESIWRASAADGKAAGELVSRLVPVANSDKVKKWIADLASADVATRDSASTALRDLGLSIETALRTALDVATDPSVRANLQSICKALVKPDLDSPDLVRRLRAIRWLDRAGAKDALKSVSGGARTRIERQWAQSLIAGPGKPVSDGPQGLRAFDELASRYRGALEVPAYDRAINQLNSEDPGQARRAGLYVVALCRQLIADEKNGRAVWKENPYWGVDAVNTARELRESLANTLGARAEGDEALESVRWLLTEEEVAKNQAEGMEALARIKSHRVLELVQPILERVHPNPTVVEGAIQLAVERGFKTLHPAILRLCTHYRRSIREKAGEAAATLGLKPIPEYVPEKAITPGLEAQLAAIASMVRPAIPSDALWCEFHVQLPSDGWTGPIDVRIPGWKLGETADVVHVVTWFGEEKKWPKKAVEVSGRKLADEVARFAEARSKEDGTDALSPGGSVMRQAEPPWMSLPEVLVAAWSLARGDRATAATVLLPRIDETEDDRWIFWASRDLLGRSFHQEMLDAFVLRRDYAEAISLARHLSNPNFDGYHYLPRAKELAAQLERRAGDFKSFVLPDPTEWAKLKTTLGRPDQIRYLGDRLRLLNCFPLDWDFFQQFQSVKPGRLAAYNKVEERINPYVEMKALGLEPADLEIVAEYIADAQFIPAYDYWRDFHPQRSLYRVSYVAAKLANETAMRELVDYEDGMDPPVDTLATWKDQVLKWAREHRGKSRPDLALEAIANCRTWWEVKSAVIACITMKEGRAFRALELRLRDFPKDQEEAAALVFYVNSPETVDQARLWLKHSDEDVRYWAARILLRHGNRAQLEGYEELKAVLDESPSVQDFTRAFDDLLSIGTEEARTFACRVLKKESFKPWEEEGGRAALQRLFLAGRPEALEYIEAKLDDPTVVYLIGKGGLDEPRTADNVITAGDCLAKQLCRWSLKEKEFDDHAPGAQRAIWRKEVRVWIRKQAALIRKGEKSELDSKPGRLPPWSGLE